MNLIGFNKAIFILSYIIYLTGYIPFLVSRISFGHAIVER